MTLPRFTAISIILYMTVLTAGCARQIHAPPEGEGYDPAACAYLRGAPEPAEFKGAGEITIGYGKQKQSGKIDVRAKAGGHFTARVYSPFGNTVAEVEADEFKGSFKAGKELHSFTYDDTISAALLPIASRFTYGGFIRVIAGGTPEFLRQLPPKPDTTSYTRKDAVALWNADTLAVWVRASRKTGGTVSVTFDYGGAYVRIGKFDKTGMPKDIYIRDMDGNYINMKYETVRAVR